MRMLPFCTLALALAVAALPAAASTPDGETPAEEEVCDIYDGAAFGLCNAYCEAMDCDHPDVHASPAACASVARNFARVTGGDELPCATPVETCSVDAQDDWAYPEEPGVIEVDAFANDSVDPASSAMAVTSYDAADNVTLVDADAGLFEVVWDAADDSIHQSFDYEVCCADECATATVTVMGFLTGS